MRILIRMITDDHLAGEVRLAAQELGTIAIGVHFFKGFSASDCRAVRRGGLWTGECDETLIYHYGRRFCRQFAGACQ